MLRNKDKCYLQTCSVRQHLPPLDYDQFIYMQHLYIILYCGIFYFYLNESSEYVFHHSPFQSLDIVYQRSLRFIKGGDFRTHNCDLVAIWLENAHTLYYILIKPFKKNSQYIFHNFYGIGKVYQISGLFFFWRFTLSKA